MKTISKLVMFAAASLALVACQSKMTEELPAVKPGYHDATLTMGSPVAKATMDGVGNVMWEGDDFVYVARSGEVVKFIATNESAEFEKSFHGVVADGVQYPGVIYNRYGAVSAFDGTSFTTVIPATQNGAAGNLIAVAKEEDVLDGGAVVLARATSGVCFTVPAAYAGTLNYVTLTALDGGDNPVGIAGNVTVNAGTAAISGADASSVTVSKSFAADEKVYIATAPLTGVSKIRMAFAGEGYNYVKKVSVADLSGFDGDAGVVNNLGTVDLSTWTNTIITVDTEAGQPGKDDAEETSTTTTIEVTVEETAYCVLNDNTKEEAVITVNDIAEGATLIIDSDADYQAKDDMVVTINLPEGTLAGAFEGLIINAPNAHVAVTVGGVSVDPQTYFKSVTATTADSTLEVTEGVTIDNLTVEKGSVIVKYGATVNNIILGAEAGQISVEYYSNVDGVKKNNVDMYAGVVVNNWIDLYTSGLITSTEELLAAIAEADTEKEYKLGANFTIDEEVFIPQDFTLDLNGFTLTNAATSCRFFTVKNGSTFTINNSVRGGGMVIAESNQQSYGFVKLNSDSSDNKLIINGGTYSGAMLNGAMFKCLASGQEIELNNVKCVVENGTGAGSGNNIHGIGVVFDANKWSQLTVNGGEFYCNTTRSNPSVAKYVFQTELTVVNIQNAKIETVMYGGFAACYGTVANTTVKYPAGHAIDWANTAIIMAHGDYAGYFGRSLINSGEFEGLYGINILTSGVETTISGGKFTGATAALHIYNNSGYPDNPFDVVITGGEFIGAGSTPVAIQTMANPNTDLQISGGKFYGALDIANADQVSITGGLFSVDPSAYVAEGYVAVASGNAEFPYEVIEAVAYNYAELAAFVEAGVPAVKLGDSFTCTKGFVLTQDLALDLNGKTLSFSATSGSDSNYKASNSRPFKVLGDADLTLVNGEIALLDSYLYGSVRFESSGKLTMTDITTNNSRNFGLNIKLLNGTAELTRVTINANVGGCIEVGGDDEAVPPTSSVATLTDCTFNQTGDDSDGWISSAVSVCYNGVATIKSGTYSARYAAYAFTSGGTINIEGGTLTGRANGAAIILQKDQNEYAAFNDSVANVTGADCQINGALSVQNAHCILTLEAGHYTVNPKDYVEFPYCPWVNAAETDYVVLHMADNPPAGYTQVMVEEYGEF